MHPLFDVTGRLALVTGSSRGLGRALALALADAGARLIVHGRDEAAIAETRAVAEERSGREALALRFDVTDAAESAAVGGGPRPPPRPPPPPRLRWASVRRS